jgi:hypothetical protein
MMIIGLDVGLKGAIVGMYEDGSICFIEKFSTFPISLAKNKTSNCINTNKLFNFLVLKLNLHKARNYNHVVMERMFIPVNRGHNSPLVMGINYGKLMSVCDFIAIRKNTEILTHASHWQKPIFLKYSKTLPKSGTTKSTSIAIARELYSEKILIPKGARKPCDGIADAILLAEYKRLKLGY